jgi:predicted transcriptional regulator of viral defense system
LAETQAERLLRYARQHGLVRPRDLHHLRIPRAAFQRLVEQGLLSRRARGVYTAAEHEPTEHTDLAAVAARAPAAIVCLLSALRFHELTTQNPFDVWIMIDRKGRPPTISHPRLRIVRASGEPLRAGVETHRLEGAAVRITNPAKTVADCFRYRRTVGTDVALEALRDCRRQRKASIDEIHRYAEIDRVVNVMRPYLESLG